MRSVNKQKLFCFQSSIIVVVVVEEKTTYKKNNNVQHDGCC